MNNTSNSRITRIFSLGLLAGFATISMAVNDDGACGGSSSVTRDGTTGADATADTSDTSIEQPQCVTAADCTRDGSADRIACDGDWQCVESMCRWSCEEPPPAGCYGDQDCTDGLVCNASEVCHAPPGCGAGQACPAVCYGECVQPEQPEVCFNDEACGLGQICDFSACNPAPNALIACGGVCIDEVVTTCSEDADCDAAEECICVSPNVSLPNARVACLLQCVPRDRGCLDDSDCKRGDSCQDYQCVATPPETCTDDSDCTLGWTCESACGGSAADPAEGERRPCPRSCQPPTVGTSCDDNGPRCELGTVCEETCWAEADDCLCSADDPSCTCAATIVCAATCVPEGGWGECSSDRPCPVGQVCGCDPSADGLCVPACLPSEAPYDCNNATNDCGDGFCRIEVCDAPMPEPCEDGTCRPIAPTCWGYCQPPYDCTTDANCLDGGYCRFDEDLCGSSSSNNTSLVPVLCEGWCTYPIINTCGTDGLVCAEGETCEQIWDCGVGTSERRPCASHFACVPVEDSCRNDSDCTGSELCVDGTCGMQYCYNGECAEGYTCHSTCDAIPSLPNALIVCPMYCVPEATACGDDCDCNANEACVGGSCLETVGTNDRICSGGNGDACYSDIDCQRGLVCSYPRFSEDADTCDCVDCSCDSAARPIPAGTCAPAP